MHVDLSILEAPVSIHRYSCDSPVPPDVYRSRFLSISRTPDELSIVCDSSILLKSDQTEAGWHVVMVVGPLDFELTGVLAAIIAPLATAKIAIFAVSTFDTDYILVKSVNVASARTVLEEAGFRFVEPGTSLNSS